jgi:hypothetical protein
MKAKALDMLKGNRKIGGSVWTWSRPVYATCPDSCHFKQVKVQNSDADHCYADDQDFFMAQTLKGALRRLGQLPLRVAKLGDNSAVRINVSGDLGSMDDGNKPDTRFIDGLVGLFSKYKWNDPQNKNTGHAWLYTHGWKQNIYGYALDKLRKCIQVNASVDTVADLKQAVSEGYRVFYSSPTVDHSQTYTLVDGIRLLNCPNFGPKKVKCDECFACARDSKNYAGVAIRTH